MSTETTVWLAFVLGGIVTYLQRASFFLIIGDRALPDPIRRALRYVAPAAFAAIVAPRVLDGFSLSEVTAPDARLLAVVFGGVLMWRIPRMPLLLVAGMAVFWLLRWVGL